MASSAKYLSSALEVIQIGPLRIEGGRRFFVDSKELRLGSFERRLLIHVVSRRGQLCLGPDIQDLAPHGMRRGRAAVQTRVMRLRRKLGRAGRLLETVHGLGYRLSTRHPLRHRVRRLRFHVA